MSKYGTEGEQRLNRHRETMLLETIPIEVGVLCLKYLQMKLILLFRLLDINKSKTN
jgi:hypothetical protein